jgi:hypothetical protein
MRTKRSPVGATCPSGSNYLRLIIEKILFFAKPIIADINRDYRPAPESHRLFQISTFRFLLLPFKEQALASA